LNIAVCLKYVPDLNSVEVDPITGVVDESRLLYLLNPADESALELALRWRGEGQVTALTVGAALSEAGLREALAVGADRVLRLWAETWTATHPFRTATMLAAALQQVDDSLSRSQTQFGNEGLPDVVLCGVKSDDRGSGQVPALLAEYLGWPVVTAITELELATDRARVQRRLERGVREVVEVALPAVLALEPDASRARLRQASLPGLIAAQRAKIPLKTPADLELSPAALDFPQSVLEATLPPRPRARTIFTPDENLSAEERIAQIISAGVTRDSGRILEGSPDQLAEAIVEFLRERGFL
jgi:electron transfer flavoprotein beta subunit